LGVNSGGESGSGGRGDGEVRREEGLAGGVALVGRAVAALLVPGTDGGGECSVLPDTAGPGELGPLVGGVGGTIDGTRSLEKAGAVGGEGGGIEPEGIAGGGGCGGGKGDGAGLEVAKSGGASARGWLPPVRDFALLRREEGTREELDGAAKGGVAPSGGAPAAHDLDAVEGGKWDFGPGYPSTKGVVKGNAVEEDESAAGAAGAEAAEGDALGGRVGGEGSGAAKKGEGGGAAEGVVEGQGGRRFEGIGGKNVYGERKGVGGLGGAGGGDDERSEDRVGGFGVGECEGHASAGDGEKGVFNHGGRRVQNRKLGGIRRQRPQKPKK